MAHAMIGIEAELSAAAAASLARVAHARRLGRGESLAWEGHDSDLCGTLVSGALKLCKGTEDGREAIVGLALPGDFVGRPFAERTGFSAAGAIDSELRLFSRAALETAVRDHPEIAMALYRRALAELDNMRGWMLVLGRQSAAEKISSLLLALNGRMGGGARFDLPLTRAEISDVLGVTIGTVSRELRALERRGLILLAGARGVRLNDAARLAAETGIPGAFT